MGSLPEIWSYSRPERVTAKAFPARMGPGEQFMTIRRMAIAALALALVAGPAGAEAVVRFEHPERYLDTTANGIAGIKAYIELLGRSLAPGLVLNVTVLHLQMAGRTDEFRPPLRIYSGDAWPSMRLRYTLTRNGRVLMSGEDRLGDTLYQQDASARGSPDRLRYEKAMLRDWFGARFAAYRRNPGG
jgi:Protein of unknown function (DUF3016)